SERARKWVKRKPALAASIVFITLALSGTLTYGLLYLESRASVAEETLKARRLTDDRRKEALRLIQQGQENRAAGHLEEARRYLASALAAIHSEPDLADLNQTIKGLLREVDDRIAQKEARDKAVAIRIEVFDLRDSALFQLYRQVFTGLDVSDSLAAAQQTARKALALCETSSEAESDPVLGDAYSDQEKKEII